jgi:membrane protein YdbS with pleckstrin-like domain
MADPQNIPQPDAEKPVAYDQYGRPLYAHPPANPETPQTEPPVVYMTRPAEPMQQHISDAARRRHEESKRLYPHLNLSEGEYVISAIRRHPIGLLSIWGVVALIIVLILIGTPIILSNPVFSEQISPGAFASLGVVLLLLGALFVLGGVIATVVYNANRFYLTNESVTQQIQHSLFSKKEQTISLANVEDASFRQHGIVQHLLNYGSLRLSTEGDETTYRFNYVSDPFRQVKLLNNAVEAFKNGRPVNPEDD